MPAATAVSTGVRCNLNSGNIVPAAKAGIAPRRYAPEAAPRKSRSKLTKLVSKDSAPLADDDAEITRKAAAAMGGATNATNSPCAAAPKMCRE